MARAPRPVTLVPGGSCLLRPLGFLRGARSPHFAACGAMTDGMGLWHDQEPACPPGHRAEFLGRMALLLRKEELLFPFREATLSLLQPCPSSRGKESLRPGVREHQEPAPLFWVPLHSLGTWLNSPEWFPGLHWPLLRT